MNIALRVVLLVAVVACATAVDLRSAPLRRMSSQISFIELEAGEEGAGDDQQATQLPTRGEGEDSTVQENSVPEGGEGVPEGEGGIVPGEGGAPGPGEGEGAVADATTLENSQQQTSVPEGGEGTLGGESTVPPIPGEGAGEGVAPAGQQPAQLSAEAQAELNKIRAEAERTAQSTMAAAAAKAKEILRLARQKNAKSGSPCDKGCSDAADRKSDAKDYMILAPTVESKDIDDRKLGLAPPMAVDTPLLKHAEKIGDLADAKHEAFLDKHEADCAGPICPLANN